MPYFGIVENGLNESFVMHNDTNAHSSANTQDWHIENGASLPHGLQVGIQVFLHLWNELTWRGVDHIESLVELEWYPEDKEWGVRGIFVVRYGPRMIFQKYVLRLGWEPQSSSLDLIHWTNPHMGGKLALCNGLHHAWYQRWYHGHSKNNNKP